MKTKVFFILAFALFVTASLQAQENEKRFGVELSVGASMATNKLNGSTLNPGFGLEGIVHYRFLPHTGVYAGWGWNRLGAEESFAGDDVCFEETGYILGLQFKHPFGDSPLSYYFRAGGLYNHVEIEDAEGELIADSGHGFGFQLAAGIDYALGKNWSITPGIKFNHLNRDIEMEGVTSPINHNYLSLRIGLLKRF